MSHATLPLVSPAWCVENDSGHALTLLPCECCAATKMTVSLGAATITFVLDDIGTLETLRDDLTAVIEHLNARHESDQPDDEDDPHEHPPRQWQGHAPSALRDEFDEWALMRRTPGTVTPEGRALFEDEIATPLSACTDALPYHYCNLLGLPHGSTYAEGVEKLRDGM